MTFCLLEKPSIVAFSGAIFFKLAVNKMYTLVVLLLSQLHYFYTARMFATFQCSYLLDIKLLRALKNTVKIMCKV